MLKHPSFIWPKTDLEVKVDKLEARIIQLEAKVFKHQLSHPSPYDLGAQRKAKK